MHLALRQMFPVLVPSQWLTETARDQTEICLAAEKQMQVDALLRRGTHGSTTAPTVLLQNECLWEPGLGGTGEECSVCVTLSKNHDDKISPSALLTLRASCLLYPFRFNLCIWTQDHLEGICWAWNVPLSFDSSAHPPWGHRVPAPAIL